MIYKQEINQEIELADATFTPAFNRADADAANERQAHQTTSAILKMQSLLLVLACVRGWGRFWRWWRVWNPMSELWLPHAAR